MAQRKTSFLSVSGRHNCAASSLKKFTNICKLSEIISLKLFHKPWNETVRALLRSKGFCYPLVNSNEILLKVNSWNQFLPSVGGWGRGAENQIRSFRQEAGGVEPSPGKVECVSSSSYLSGTDDFPQKSGPAFLPGSQWEANTVTLTPQLSTLSPR